MINFSDYISVSVMIFCLCIGYILRDSVKILNNNYIPSILMVVGAISYCIMKNNISVDSIVIGMISGFASTGLHQNFKKFAVGIGELAENKKENIE